MIYIVTPCTRVYNLDKITACLESIPVGCVWVVCYDAATKRPPKQYGHIEIQSDVTGCYGNPTRNYALNYLKSIMTDYDWLYILDDDNILHPNWYEEASKYSLYNNYNDFIHWGQCFPNGITRTKPSLDFDMLDTAQYMVRWSVAKNIRFEEKYEADGYYAKDCFDKSSNPVMIDSNLAYYNYLRSNKMGDTTRVRICMISMFKNEANNIRTMLDSVAPYIDYWVLQDNGSTDGTPDIVREWAEKTGIPGKLYDIDEGWVNYGYNRDHLLQTALKEPHGCDWIMKMDCDETLEVDEDFDWSIFWTPHQSFHVPATGGNMVYFRAWIWNAKLPWKFNHDPAHETIYLDDGKTGENFVRTNLPNSFRMVSGQSYGES